MTKLEPYLGYPELREPSLGCGKHASSYLSSLFVRAISILFASTALAFFAPLMIIVSFLVWLDLGNPIIFRQARPGKDLRPINICKFRTMRPDLDNTGRHLSDAERQTRFSRILRRTRFDELPQLFNVLVGDMDLIGPRPILPRDMPDLALPGAIDRYSVRPGMTGWGQVNGNSLLTPQERLVLDLYYIQNRSILRDLQIIMRTCRMIVFGEVINKSAVIQAFDELPETRAMVTNHAE